MTVIKDESLNFHLVSSKVTFYDQNLKKIDFFARFFNENCNSPSLTLAGLILIRFPHFQSEIQRTDWLQKVRLTQHANFAGAKLENFLAKTFCSQSVR